jgi:hypothetical protein
MAIEWPTAPATSTMKISVPDNSPAGSPTGPADVLDADDKFAVKVAWEVPAPYNALLGGSFRVRAFAESIGPGQEMQLGQSIAAVVPGQTNYQTTINVAGNTLKGEGELDGGVPVSGIYKIVGVLQHINGSATVVSGFAEENLRMFRKP